MTSALNSEPSRASTRDLRVGDHALLDPVYGREEIVEVVSNKRLRWPAPPGDYKTEDDPVIIVFRTVPFGREVKKPRIVARVADEQCIAWKAVEEG